MKGLYLGQRNAYERGLIGLLLRDAQDVLPFFSTQHGRSRFASIVEGNKLVDMWQLCEIDDDGCITRKFEREYWKRSFRIGPTSIKAIRKGVVELSKGKVTLADLPFRIDEEFREVLTRWHRLKQLGPIPDCARHTISAKTESIKRIAEDLAVAVDDEDGATLQRLVERLNEDHAQLFIARALARGL